MENLGKVTLFAIMIVGAFLTALLGAKIIMSIADLYQLCFITKLSFVQLYGLITIINIVKYKKEKTKEEKEDFETMMKKAFSGIIGTIFFLLAGWGIAYVSFYIIS